MMVAEPQHAPDRYARAVVAIHALISDLGIGRHALFHEVGEGTAFPDGSEAMSGYVLDELGRTYFFWTGWDGTRGRAVFTIWEPAETDPAWRTSEEHQQARAAVGLPRLQP
jgi:hypothetical protein